MIYIKGIIVRIIALTVDKIRIMIHLHVCQGIKVFKNVRI